MRQIAGPAYPSATGPGRPAGGPKGALPGTRGEQPVEILPTSCLTANRRPPAAESATPRSARSGPGCRELHATLEARPPDYIEPVPEDALAFLPEDFMALPVHWLPWALQALPMALHISGVHISPPL